MANCVVFQRDDQQEVEGTVRQGDAAVHVEAERGSTFDTIFTPPDTCALKQTVLAALRRDDGTLGREESRLLCGGCHPGKETEVHYTIG